MYVFDFLKKLLRTANMSTVIYLVLNVIIMICLLAFILNFYTRVSDKTCIIVGIVGYFISLCIALSPFGEWILRRQMGCKEITDEGALNMIMPIFNEVYARARKAEPNISSEVELFMTSDASVNAFATGRRTVVVTAGMLNRPPAQIRATLGHEFGHLAHKDTDILQVIVVGNAIVGLLGVGFRWLILMFQIVSSMAFGMLMGRRGGTFVAVICNWITDMTILATMWLWNKLGFLLLMKSSRENEFEADAFSYKLGYGEGMIDMLSFFGDSGEKGLFALLSASHPESSDRIKRLKNLMQKQGGGAIIAEGSGKSSKAKILPNKSTGQVVESSIGNTIQPVAAITSKSRMEKAAYKYSDDVHDIDDIMNG